MPSSTLSSLLAAILVTATGPAIAQSCSNDKSTDYQDPVVADGWTYRLVANDFRNPRGIEFDDDGHLLVIDRGEGIVRLQLEDEGGDCVSVKDKSTIVKDDNLNHGIALSSDGKWLYASTVDEVYRWPYSSSSSSLDSRRTIVNNMTNSGHSTRTLLLPPSQPDLLLVSRGSEGNDDAGARDIDSGRSQLRSFNLSSVSEDDDADPIDYINGDVLAWGLRNSVGVAEHPNGGIWSVENSVDNLERDGEDVHRDNPGEELNFHGLLNRSSDETGANYGYPMCVALWDTEGFPERGGMETGDQFATADGDLDDDECRKDYMKPRLTFQAHSAPLDIKFNKNGSEAFVTFHGSWNREEPVGYKLVSVAFSSDGQPSADSGSTSAATTILSNKDLSRCPDDCFRPVGLAWDKNGRLFMSSDSTGEIFVLHRNSTGGNSDDGSDEGDSGSSSGGDDDDEDGVVGMQQFAPRSAAWAVSFAALVIGMLLA